MDEVKRIAATRARNKFFEILRKSYLEKQIFLIEKGGIPIAYIIPTTAARIGNLIDREKSKS